MRWGSGSGRHLTSAQEVCAHDPEGGYALLYDAAGRRSPVAGKPRAAADQRRWAPRRLQAVRAQLDPPMGAVLSPFDRMRRQRRDAEYPPVHTPELGAADVREDVPKVQAILDLAARVLDEMSPF
jgi:hypothetical protein